jgi:hypothetical protein
MVQELISFKNWRRRNGLSDKWSSHRKVNERMIYPTIICGAQARPVEYRAYRRRRRQRRQQSIQFTQSSSLKLDNPPTEQEKQIFVIRELHDPVFVIEERLSELQNLRMRARNMIIHLFNEPGLSW